MKYKKSYIFTVCFISFRGLIIYTLIWWYMTIIKFRKLYDRERNKVLEESRTRFVYILLFNNLGTAPRKLYNFRDWIELLWSPINITLKCANLRQVKKVFNILYYQVKLGPRSFL